MGETRKREAAQAVTNRVTNRKAPRVSRYFGVVEARVEFLGAAAHEVPEVFKDLARDPLTRHKEWAGLLAEGIPETPMRKRSSFAACATSISAISNRGSRSWWRSWHATRSCNGGRSGGPARLVGTRHRAVRPRADPFGRGACFGSATRRSVPDRGRLRVRVRSNGLIAVPSAGVGNGVDDGNVIPVTFPERPRRLGFA